MATGPSPPRMLCSHGAPVEVAPRRAILTRTAWSPLAKLTISEWMRQGQTLGAAARACGWWIGDWIRFGNAQYGEK
jgi:hypothetical protein